MQIICKALALFAVAAQMATAQPTVATGSVRHSTIKGGRVNLISSGDATGSASVTVDGRIKNIGSTSQPNGTAANMTDIDAVRGTPMMSEVKSDPTVGIPAPPVTSQAGSPVPGTIGTYSTVSTNMLSGNAIDTSAPMLHSDGRRHLRSIYYG